MLLLNHCLLLLPLLVGALCLCLFCYAVLCAVSSFAIILMKKRELVALLVTSLCLVNVSVLWLFLTVPWVGLQCVIVAFPGHTHLHLYSFNLVRNVSRISAGALLNSFNLLGQTYYCRIYCNRNKLLKKRCASF